MGGTNMETGILLESGTNELEILEFRVGNNYYGINVAKLANIPLEVILRAEDILNKLQMVKIAEKANLSITSYQAPMIYDSKTEKEISVLNKIKDVNLYALWQKNSSATPSSS